MFKYLFINLTNYLNNYSCHINMYIGTVNNFNSIHKKKSLTFIIIS